MRTDIHRPARLARAAFFDHLEPRAMLGGSNNVIDLDGDTFSVLISGPGTFSTTMGAEGARLLAFTGTASNTDIVISRTSQDGDGFLNIHSLTVAGDIDELRTDEFVNFNPEFLQPNPGISIGGRVRVINIDGDLIGGDITIASTANANKSSITIARARGELLVLQLGPGPTDIVNITSGGIIDRLDIADADFVRASARRFGTVLLGQGNPKRGPVPFGFGMTFEVTATDSNAPYGIKSLTVAGAIDDGTVLSFSPVQSILVDQVTEDFGGGSGGSFTSVGTQRGLNPNLVGSIDIDVNGKLGTFKARTGSFAGTLGATTFGAIEVFDFFVGTVHGFGGVLPLSVSPTSGIDSFRAGYLFDSFIDAGGPGNNGTGFIKSMIVGEINVSTINTGWMGTCAVTGSGSNSADGDVFDSTITLNNTTRAKALDVMTVADQFNNSHLRVLDNNVGSITLNGGFDSDSSIEVGVSDISQAFTGNPFNGSNRSIASLKLKAPLGDGAVFNNGVIAAKTISSLTSTLRSSSSIGPGRSILPFGVVADVISSISFRVPNNSVFTSANTSFADIDFNIRVI